MERSLYSERVCMRYEKKEHDVHFEAGDRSTHFQKLRRM